MTRVSRYPLILACLVPFLAVACDDDDDDWRRPPPELPEAVGSLVFDWSIEGRQDADACVEVEAVTFEAIIVDEGFIIGGVSAPCEDFEARVDLYEDDFLARSSLLDASGRPALGRIFEDLFVIGEGQETRLVMDFPSQPVPMDPVPDAGLPPSTPDAGEAATPDAATPDASPPAEAETPADAGVDAAAP